MLMNYHISRLVLSSLCVGAFGAAGVVIHQHSHKLLKMDILMSETC